MNRTVRVLAYDGNQLDILSDYYLRNCTLLSKGESFKKHDEIESLDFSIEEDQDNGLILSSICLPDSKIVDLIINYGVTDNDLDSLLNIINRSPIERLHFSILTKISMDKICAIIPRSLHLSCISHDTPGDHGESMARIHMLLQLSQSQLLMKFIWMLSHRAKFLIPIHLIREIYNMMIGCYLVA